MFILRTCARNSATTPSIRASLRRFAASDTASDERIVEMKGSLWTRLMGVFLGVIVVGVIVMVVSIRLSTASQLRRRVLSNDVAQANALAALLGSYYSQNGGWNEVELYLASVPQAQTPPTLQMGPGMMGPGMMDNSGEWMDLTRSTGSLDRVVVLDDDGEVIADTGLASL